MTNESPQESPSYPRYKSPQEVKEKKLFSRLGARIKEVQREFEDAQTPEVRRDAAERLDTLNKYKIVQGLNKELKRLREELQQYKIGDVRREHLLKNIHRLEANIEDVLLDIRGPLPKEARDILIEAQTSGMRGDGASSETTPSTTDEKEVVGPYDAFKIIQEAQVGDTDQSAGEKQEEGSGKKTEGDEALEDEHKELARKLLTFMEFDDLESELNAEARVARLVGKHPEAARVLLTIFETDDYEVQSALISEWNRSQPAIGDDENVLLRMPINRAGTILDVIEGEPHIWFLAFTPSEDDETQKEEEKHHEGDTEQDESNDKRSLQELVDELIAIDEDAAITFRAILRETDHYRLYAKVALWNKEQPELNDAAEELYAEVRSNFEVPDVSVRVAVLTDGVNVRFLAEPFVENHTFVREERHDESFDKNRGTATQFESSVGFFRPDTMKALVQDLIRGVEKAMRESSATPEKLEEAKRFKEELKDYFDSVGDGTFSDYFTDKENQNRHGEVVGRYNKLIRELGVNDLKIEEVATGHTGTGEEVKTQIESPTSQQDEQSEPHEDQGSSEGTGQGEETGGTGQATGDAAPSGDRQQESAGTQRPEEQAERIPTVSEARDWKELYDAIDNHPRIKKESFLDTDGSARFGVPGADMYKYMIDNIRADAVDKEGYPVELFYDGFGIQQKVIELRLRELVASYAVNEKYEQQINQEGVQRLMEKSPKAARRVLDILRSKTLKQAESLVDGWNTFNKAKEDERDPVFSYLYIHGYALEVYMDDDGRVSFEFKPRENPSPRPSEEVREPTKTNNEDEVLELTDQVYLSENGQLFRTKEQLDLFNQLKEQMSSLPSDGLDDLDGKISTLVRINTPAAEALLAIRNAPDYEASRALMGQWNESVADWTEEATELIKGVTLHGEELVVFLDLDKHVKFAFARTDEQKRNHDQSADSEPQSFSESSSRRSFATEEQLQLYNELNSLGDLEQEVYSLVTEHPDAARTLRDITNTQTNEEARTLMGQWNGSVTDWQENPQPSELINGMMLHGKELVVFKDDADHIQFGFITTEGDTEPPAQQEQPNTEQAVDAPQQSGDELQPLFQEASEANEAAGRGERGGFFSKWLRRPGRRGDGSAEQATLDSGVSDVASTEVDEDVDEDASAQETTQSSIQESAPDVDLKTLLQEPERSSVEFEEFVRDNRVPEHDLVAILQKIMSAGSYEDARKVANEEHNNTLGAVFGGNNIFTLGDEQKLVAVRKSGNDIVFDVKRK